ncbi:MAG: DEAD/DEAH box helicase [Phycisphaerales bacterium]|nr:DEAD/DEAH box helicase [Phycisphaerales bacterium]
MLHANWSDGRLVIWAESLRRFLLLTDPQGSKQAEPGPGTEVMEHPFAMPVEELRAILAAHVPEAALGSIEEIAIPIQLPRDLLGPWPSDPLANLVGGVETLDVPSLGDFLVPGLAVDPADLVPLVVALGRATRNKGGKSGLHLGPSIDWWKAVGFFSLDLMMDQRFIPSLRQDERAMLHASWRPWLHDEEVCRRLEAILASMPPVIRAVRDDLGEGAWPRLESALVGIIDSHIRRLLIADDFVEALDERDPSDPHVAWLSGLLAEGQDITRDGEAGRSLFRDARRWISRLDDIGADLEYRLWLKLESPPGGDSEPWRLDVGLHSSTEPIQQLTAEDVWTQSPEALGSARDNEAEPQDVLVTELGRAARLYPVLEPLLSEATPAGLTLDTATAAQFLSEYKPLLEEAGCIVTAPSWWSTTDGSLGLQLSIDADDLESVGGEGSLSGLNTMVAYRWQVAVGDQPLSLEELKRLGRQRSPLVQIHGKWVEINPEQVAKAVAFLEKSESDDRTMRLIDALRMASGGEDEETGLAITGLESSGWVSELLGDGTCSWMDQIKQPELFAGSLRPYQLRGLGWLSFLDRLGLGACLADDMGLGKTVQLIGLLQWERAQTTDKNTAFDPTLLVVPTSVIGNWERELHRFAPELTAYVHHGPTRSSGQEFCEKVHDKDVVITTYALVSRDQESLQKQPWHRVVLDEAQYIKNPPTKQTVAIRSLDTDRRIALTGTPVENRLSELWSIMEFCNPGYLGEVSDFRRRFARPIERHRDSRQAAQLKRLVQPFVLRRLKTDRTVISDLPECVETREFATLSHEQAMLYEQVVDRMLGKVDRSDGIQRRGLILAMLGKLKQICDHPALAESGDDLANLVSPDGDDLRSLCARSGKAQRMMTLLEEVLAAGERALVFTQYRRMGRLLSAMIEHDLGAESLFLHGGTPVAKRQKMIDGFQAEECNTPVFVLSLKAGGLGLNLTAANHVFHFDRWWNPAVERQATDRAFRIGQSRTVHVHKFVCLGTLEERIDQMIQEKTALAENIIGSGDDWLTELSTGQLREVLMLRADAMEVEA